MLHICYYKKLFWWNRKMKKNNYFACIRTIPISFQVYPQFIWKFCRFEFFSQQRIDFPQKNVYRLSLWVIGKFSQFLGMQSLNFNCMVVVLESNLKWVRTKRVISHLIRSRAITNRIFFSEKTFFSSCACDQDILVYQKIQVP